MHLLVVSGGRRDYFCESSDFFELGWPNGAQWGQDLKKGQQETYKTKPTADSTSTDSYFTRLIVQKNNIKLQQTEKLKNQENDLNNIKSEVSDLKSEIGDIKDMIQQLLNK